MEKIDEQLEQIKSGEAFSEPSTTYSQAPETLNESLIPSENENEKCESPKQNLSYFQSLQASPVTFRNGQK